MEVAQRYSIAWKGLKNGRHDFRFEVDKALFEAFESTEIKDGRCEVSVGVDRSEKQLTLDVGITGYVVVECDRCLEDCRVPIDFEGQLVVKFSDEVHEYDGEVMWMLPGEDRVELAQYIYESIVLSLPYQRVHPEGECNPEMLERFRIVSDREFASIEAAAEGAGERGGGEWAKLAALRERVDVEAIRGANLRVVCDPLYGAGRHYLAGLLRDMGVEVVEIHNTEDPTFAGLHPEPIQPWVDEGLAKVGELGYDALFINDGDADRIAAGDSRGNYVNAHRIITLLTKHMVDRGETGRVVSTVTASAMLDRMCRKLGLELVSTPVGFKWIYGEMEKGGVMRELSSAH